LEGERSTRSFKLKGSQSAHPNLIPKERESKHQESAKTQGWRGVDHGIFSHKWLVTIACFLFIVIVANLGVLGSQRCSIPSPK